MIRTTDVPSNTLIDAAVFIRVLNDDSIYVIHRCSNSAACCLRLHLYLEAVREATLAVGAAFCSSPLYLKTLFRRAKAFQQLNRPFEALGEFEKRIMAKKEGINV